MKLRGLNREDALDRNFGVKKHGASLGKRS